MQGTTKSKHSSVNSRYIEEFNNKYNIKNKAGYNDFTKSNRYKKSLMEYREYSKKNRGGFSESYVDGNPDSTYESDQNSGYYGGSQYSAQDYSASDTAIYSNQTSVPSNSNIIDYNKERTYYAAARKNNNLTRKNGYASESITDTKNNKRNISSIDKGRTSKSVSKSQPTDKLKQTSKFSKIESIEKLQRADVTASAKSVNAVKRSVKENLTLKSTNAVMQQDNSNNNNNGYVYGNVALQLEPIKKAQTSEQKRTNRHVEKNREKAFAMNLPTIACLTIVIMVAFTICIQYLSLQSTIRVRLNNIKKMQSQLENMITDNDVLELNISNSTDLNSVYQRATEEFGMSYPSQDQIVTYDSVESEYVRQYDNIPTD